MHMRAYTPMFLHFSLFLSRSFFFSASRYTNVTILCGLYWRSWRGTSYRRPRRRTIRGRHKENAAETSSTSKRKGKDRSRRVGSKYL